MAIPKFEDFLYPFLCQLKNGDVTKKDMVKALIEHFSLTEDDCLLMTHGGAGQTTQLNDRVGWVLQYLRRVKFVEIPQRGTYRLTERGRSYLNTHDDLRRADLMQYPEFVAFVNGSKVGDPPTTSVGGAVDEMTPTEQLESAYQSILEDLAADILQKTLEQTPQFFERLVLDLLLKMGYGDPTNAQVTQYVHDDGVDGIIPEDKLGLDKIYIQAKRYQPSNTIGKPQIHEFAGALDEQKANKGVFITTSSYSKEAKAFVEKSSKKIVLIDGKQLARYMIEYNVGVSTKKVYAVKKIDSDYFDE